MKKFFLLSLALYYSGYALASNDNVFAAPTCPKISGDDNIKSSVSVTYPGEASCTYIGNATIDFSEENLTKTYTISIKNGDLEASINNHPKCSSSLLDGKTTIHASCIGGGSPSDHFYYTYIESKLFNDYMVLTQKNTPISAFVFGVKDDDGKATSVYVFNSTINAVKNVGVEDSITIAKESSPIKFDIVVYSSPKMPTTVLPETE